MNKRVVVGLWAVVVAAGLGVLWVGYQQTGSTENAVEFDAELAMEELLNIARVPPEFPERIITGDARPVDAASAFIDQRYDQILAAVAAFERYARAVRDDNPHSEFAAAAQFRFGHVLRREWQRDTKSIVEAYPELAFMSAEERQFITRKLAERDEAFSEAWEGVEQRVTRLGWPDPRSQVDMRFVRTVFLHGHLLPPYLAEISELRLEAFTRAARRGLLAADQQAQWRAILRSDRAALAAFFADDAWAATYTVLSEAVESVLDDDFNKDDRLVRELAMAALLQELWYTPAGMQLSTFAHLGLNTLIGYEARDALSERLAAAGRRVEAAGE